MTQVTTTPATLTIGIDLGRPHEATSVSSTQPERSSRRAGSRRQRRRCDRVSRIRLRSVSRSRSAGIPPGCPSFLK